MELSEFVQNFAAQFDETDPSEFSPTTAFNQLAEWSSLSALAIIAMVDESYKVKIKGDDIRQAITIEQLFEIVKSRL